MGKGDRVASSGAAGGMGIGGGSNKVGYGGARNQSAGPQRRQGTPGSVSGSRGIAPNTGSRRPWEPSNTIKRGPVTAQRSQQQGNIPTTGMPTMGGPAVPSDSGMPRDVMSQGVGPQQFPQSPGIVPGGIPGRSMSGGQIGQPAWALGGINPSPNTLQQMLQSQGIDPNMWMQLQRSRGMGI